MKGKASKTKRSYGKKRSYRKKTNNKMPKGQGSLKIARKCPEFWIQNTGVSGVPRIGNIVSGAEVTYTGTTLALGTATLGMNGAYDVPFAMNFRLSDLPGFSEITTLCDKYKFGQVEIKINPSFTNNPISGLYNWPQFNYVIDRDDSTILTVAQIREKQGLRSLRFNPNKPLVIRFTPKYNVGVFNNPLNPTIEPSGIVGKNGWLDSASPNIAHFGIKGYIGNIDLPINSTSKFGMKFDCTYTILAADFQ